MNTAAFDQLAEAFTALTAQPYAPTLPGAVTGTREPATITDVADILHNRATDPRLCDRIWAHLVEQSRHDATAVVFAAGLALPGLRRAAARAARICPSLDPGDTDAEVLTGFVNALSTLDTTRPAICSRLCQAAFSTARTYARRHIHAERTRQHAFASRTPPPVSGHIDLVLAAAIREGVITRFDAHLIGATRLDGRSLCQLADSRNEPVEALHQQRATAEAALARWLAKS